MWQLENLTATTERKMSMGKLSYKYTDFNIENHSITFDPNSDGVLISFPFTEDTPDRIKYKLNDIINQALTEWMENNAIEGCIPIAENLLLNARMQIDYCNGKEPRYYIDAIITDLIIPVGTDLWLTETYNIRAEEPEFQNEFMTYCRYQLEKILFPDLR